MGEKQRLLHKVKSWPKRIQIISNREESNDNAQQIAWNSEWNRERIEQMLFKNDKTIEMGEQEEKRVMKIENTFMHVKWLNGVQVCCIDL